LLTKIKLLKIIQPKFWIKKARFVWGV